MQHSPVGFSPHHLVLLLVLLTVVYVVVILVRHRRHHRRGVVEPPTAPPRPLTETFVATRAHSTPPPTTPPPGPPHDTLLAGRFTPLEEIGRGGMGVVWRAMDTVLGRQVAIKQVLPPTGLSAEAKATVRARMLREARAAAQLDHTHAVTVYDALVERDSVLIVMELVNAPTLNATVESEGPLPLSRVTAIGLGMLDVLTAAHGLGIVHRDVKPANVLVRQNGLIKLADFGIARLQGDPTLTDAGALIGTPAYMAPEQIRGLESSPATDLWGLGATLFYASEGQPAFGRTSPTAALAAVLTEPPPTPLHAAPPLSSLLLDLLAKNPDDRPTPAELRSELSRLASRL